MYSQDDLVSKTNEINKELQEVTNWFKVNKLSVNAGKTNYMLLGTRYGNAKYVESVPANRDIQVQLDDTNLQKVVLQSFLELS